MSPSVQKKTGVSHHSHCQDKLSCCSCMAQPSGMKNTLIRQNIPKARGFLPRASQLWRRAFI